MGIRARGRERLEDTGVLGRESGAGARSQEEQGRSSMAWVTGAGLVLGGSAGGAAGDLPACSVISMTSPSCWRGR